MPSRSFWFELGTYRIKLPGYSTIKAEVHMPVDETISPAFTNWTVELGRFQLFIHLSNNPLSGLKEFIDTETRGDVVVQEVLVNGISGVTYGGYNPTRTWIDWWFRKKDLTISFCLQSKVFPSTEPNEIEMNEHSAIIASLTSNCAGDA